MAVPADEARNTPETAWAAVAITILILAGFAGVVSLGHLYADGANYLLKLLEARDFVHIAENRLFATYLNQAPLIIALNQYEPTIAGAAAVYGLTLYGIPVFAWSYALWLSRRDPVAFFLTVGGVSIVFLSTIFVIIGEFHIFYSLTWLYAIVITSDRRREGWHPFLLLFTAIVTIKCYEAAAVTAPVLMVLTLLVLRHARRTTEQVFLVLLLLLLAASLAVGVRGYIRPRDPGNAGGFVASMLKLFEDRDLFLPAAVLLASGAAAFIRPKAIRLLAALGIAAAGISAVAGKEITGNVDVLTIGSPNTQRAQALPFALILLGLQLLNWQFGWGRRLAEMRVSLAPLIAPIAVSVFVYATDLNRWQHFLALTCAELKSPSGEAYYNRPLVTTFGWNWEMPTLAVLLRPAGSTAMLSFPGYEGWYPFDPATEQPDIESVKKGRGLCPG